MFAGYDSLLKYSGKVKYVYMGKNTLFYTSETSLSQADFLRYSLEEYRSMDIELFIENIYEQYDVLIKKDRMIAVAKLAAVYAFIAAKIWKKYKPIFYGETYY